jgi:type III secretion protein Q
MSNLEHDTDSPDAEAYADEHLSHEPEDDSQTADMDPLFADAADEQDETPEDEDEDEANAQDDATSYDEFVPPPAELDPVAHLPLDLTVRCGQLNLSLGQLRQLSSGTVLVANGVTPGFATLCHGERVVAEGELVEVDGRLGLQITRTAALS